MAPAVKGTGSPRNVAAEKWESPAYARSAGLFFVSVGGIERLQLLQVTPERATCETFLTGQGVFSPRFSGPVMAWPNIGV